MAAWLVLLVRSGQPISRVSRVASLTAAAGDPIRSILGAVAGSRTGGRLFFCFFFCFVLVFNLQLRPQLEADGVVVVPGA